MSTTTKKGSILNNIINHAVKLAQHDTICNVFDLQVYKRCIQYNMVPEDIQNQILTALSLEECLDQVSDRVVHEYHQSQGATSTICETQAETTEQIVDMIHSKFNISVESISEIISDLCAYKVESNLHNPESPMVTKRYGSNHI